MHRFILLVAIVLLAAALLLSACIPVPPAPEPSLQQSISLKEARQIASRSECAQVGALTNKVFYNSNSKTWWIDLEAHKAGCSPACVVDAVTRTAVVNWRCTGLITPDGSAQMANPASVNCEKQGGTLTIETQPAGGQYGVCTFADGKQCEEWALFRGACPVGGVEVNDFATNPSRYCAITGGAYTATAHQGADDEQGTCKLPSGKECDADAYYQGTCPAE